MTHSFVRSSVGKKIAMAVTGLILLGFVLVHMLGNLQIFLGRETLNAYAEHLQDFGPLLWVARLVLLTALVVHVWSASRLTWENARARPVGYGFKDTVQASYASRTMMMSGIIVFLFIVYHLLHYTLFVVHPQYRYLIDAKGRHDVYAMVVLSYQNVLVSSAYVLAMLALAFHLSHGIQSLFQTIGFNHPKHTPRVKAAGIALSFLILFGNASIPVAVMVGALRPPGAP
ncbi:MAG TPA: succinate dehydrogenase cytochrome b subunit [Candidatus Eisenbacteria bacterium]|nr:succinate dehydrogenase cytochrome b subunit [Candidatus Eisenbacteria bacterium]